MHIANRRSEAPSPWDGMLTEAVKQGLGAPNTTPGNRSIGRVLDSQLDSQLDSPEPPATIGTSDAQALLDLARPIQMRVSGATARTMALLRGPEVGPAALRAELEAWMLEAGRVEAAVEDALHSAAESQQELESQVTQSTTEASACRRALEVHIANRNRDTAQEAQREADDEEAHSEEKLRLEAELAQARAEVQGLAEEHGQRLREAQIAAHDASQREAALLRQVEDERHAARLAIQSAKASDEQAQQTHARVSLLEAERGRDEETRRAWANERRAWSESGAATAATAAARHDELFATLQTCRRQLEHAQLDASKALSRAAAAEDRASAADGAREMSDAVWQEKLSAVQAEVALRRQEIADRDETISQHDYEQSGWKAAEAELCAANEALQAELRAKDNECRAISAEAAGLHDEVAVRQAQVESQTVEMESLAEEILALQAEGEAARADAATARTESTQARGIALDETRRSTAACEHKLANQEARWLAQAAAWRDEMHVLRHKAAAAEALAAEAQAQLSTARAQNDSDCAKLRAKLTMSEQAGGARAAALTSELERLRGNVGLAGVVTAAVQQQQQQQQRQQQQHHRQLGQRSTSSPRADAAGMSGIGAVGTAHAWTAAETPPCSPLLPSVAAQTAATEPAAAHLYGRQRSPPVPTVASVPRSSPSRAPGAGPIDARATLASLLDDAW